MRKFAIIVVILLPTTGLSAQADTGRQAGEPVFFAAPVAEAVWYGRDLPSVGYGFKIVTEGFISMGIKGIYAMPLAEDDLTTLEVTLFVRVYLTGVNAVSGAFLQLNFGPAIFSSDSKISLPEESGMFSIGFTAGWRFLLGRWFFIEPYVRGGYPYYGGGGLSVGVRF